MSKPYAVMDQPSKPWLIAAKARWDDDDDDDDDDDSINRLESLKPYRHGCILHAAVELKSKVQFISLFQFISFVIIRKWNESRKKWCNQEAEKVQPLSQAHRPLKLQSPRTFKISPVNKLFHIIFYIIANSVEQFILLHEIFPI